MSSDSNDDTQARPSPAAEDGASHANSHKSSASPARAVESESDITPSLVQATEPPLPDEEAPPLPDEPPPNAEDDGWEAKWDYNAGAWYFYNNKTGHSQWENPRVPEATAYSHGSYDRFANYHHLFFFS